MTATTGKLVALAAIIAALLVSQPAHAFRCGTKIVRDGMHEQQVLAICGEPTSIRNLGYAVRTYDFRWRRGLLHHGTRRYPGYDYISEEVPVIEYVYNFGPRKLMRRLVFEGSVLVRIETIGYGYHER